MSKKKKENRRTEHISIQQVLRFQYLHISDTGT